ncbi:ABC transporter ATP-binding protein [Aquimarina agarivorans]|uniref:ABC transporter ATP-binding protein n=1 Tax=Aquimarina agarivorans TaxID=980584 RepID=UPI000248EA65|nr:ABC transporter ATP-binding protein [Aquimarina agarivorans]
MIEFKDYCFYYNKKKPLFSGFNFKLPKGKIYGLFGENGSGKTTLLNAISGLNFPKEGEILVNNYSPSDRLPSFLNDVFMVPDTLELPKIKKASFLAIYAAYYPNFSLTDFESYLKAFSIAEIEKPYRASFGQQKKFMLAFAFACNTGFVILDEPTNGLDIPSKNQFRKIIASLMNDERTIIISTHQSRDLEQVIDHVLVINDKKLLVNEGVFDITEKIAFNFYNSKPEYIDDVLLCEETIGGYKVIEKNIEGIHTELDIEMLVTACFSNPDAIINVLNK